MTTLTWLHLSDFHIKGTEGPSAAADFADLLSNIKKARQEHGLTPDVVFFTGDVAFSGKSEEYERAINYFDNLLEACGLKDKRDKLYLVPGNHDVDRKQAPNITFVPQLESLLAHETSYDVLEEFLKNVSNNVAGARDLVFSKFTNFAGFMDNLFASTGVIYERNKLHYVRPILEMDMWQSSWGSIRRGRRLIPLENHRHPLLISNKAGFCLAYPRWLLQSTRRKVNGQRPACVSS